MKINKGEIKKLEKLKEDIIGAEAVVNKAWLIEKVDEKINF